MHIPLRRPEHPVFLEIGLTHPKLVAALPHGRGVRVFVRRIGDDEEDVDDRLRRESGHGGGTDVFDPKGGPRRVRLQCVEHGGETCPATQDGSAPPQWHGARDPRCVPPARAGVRASSVTSAMRLHPLMQEPPANPRAGACLTPCCRPEKLSETSGRYCVSRAGIEPISPIQASAERRQICTRGVNRSRWFKVPVRRLRTFGPSPVDVA